MKRLIVFMLLLATTLALCACGAKDDTQAGGTPDPNAGLFSPLTDPADDDLSDPLSSAQSPALPDKSLDDGDAGLDAGLGDDLDIPEDDSPDEDPLDSSPAVAPTPTPAPAQGATVALKDYKYETYSDSDLGLSMQYPSHWSVESGSNTLTFVEPVASGIPMRLALSVKTYDGKLTAAQQKQEFTSYMTAIKDSYQKFQKSKNNNELSFINRASLSCQYKAQQDGKVVRGFVIMCKVEKADQPGQIVALHFSAPKAKYNKNSSDMFKKVMYSVAPLTGTA